MSWNNPETLDEIVGKTIIRLDGGEESEHLKFYMSDGSVYNQEHHQDCCESVHIEDICGDLEDLIGSPLLQAEEVTYSSDEEGKDEWPEGIRPEDKKEDDYWDDSYTWTFYKFATIKGSVTVRWFGSSNGYYSESVSFDKIEG